MGLVGKAKNGCCDVGDGDVPASPTGLVGEELDVQLLGGAADFTTCLKCFLTRFGKTKKKQC